MVRDRIPSTVRVGAIQAGEERFDELICDDRCALLRGVIFAAARRGSVTRPSVAAALTVLRDAWQRKPLLRDPAVS